MKKIWNRSIYLVFCLFFVFNGSAFAVDEGALPTGLGGFQAIADDIFNLVMWVVWTGGPILFIVALIRYMKSNDPGDKKDSKKWMTVITICFIAAQLAVWFLRDYIAPKFA